METKLINNYTPIHPIDDYKNFCDWAVNYKEKKNYVFSNQSYMCFYPDAIKDFFNYDLTEIYQPYCFINSNNDIEISYHYKGLPKCFTIKTTSIPYYAMNQNHLTEILEKTNCRLPNIIEAFVYIMLENEICKLYEWYIPQTAFLTSDVLKDIRVYDNKQSDVYMITYCARKTDINEEINNKSKGYNYLWEHKEEYKPFWMSKKPYYRSPFILDTSINFRDDAIWGRGFMNIQNNYGMQLLLIEK